MTHLHTSKTRGLALSLAWTFCVTADYLDPVGVHLIRVVELEVDILDDEGPDIVAKAVGIQVALQIVCQQIGAQRVRTHGQD